MKLIKKKKVIHDKKHQMFYEFSLLKSIDHPHILRLYELFEDRKNYYLVTEFCAGLDVLSQIQKTDHFKESDAISIFRQILSAILYCHDNNIVHRDIKADNIIFTKNDIHSPVKLIDFGISVKFQKNIPLKDKTGTVSLFLYKFFRYFLYIIFSL